MKPAGHLALIDWDFCVPYDFFLKVSQAAQLSSRPSANIQPLADTLKGVSDNTEPFTRICAFKLEHLCVW